MRLYMHPAAPNCLKPMIVGAHLDIPLERRFVDLFRDEHRSAEYLAVAPTGLVPALQDGDFVLWESNAIVQYIASLKPNELWPDDVRARADISRWQCWELAHWTPAVSTYLRENLFKRLKGSGDPDSEELSRGDERFHPLARLLDRHLAGRGWLVGDALTLADISVGAFLVYAEPAGVPLERYANIRGWLARLRALASWQAVEPRLDP